LEKYIEWSLTAWLEDRGPYLNFKHMTSHTFFLDLKFAQKRRGGHNFAKRRLLVATNGSFCRPPLSAIKSNSFSCINTLLYVAGLLGWLGFRPFDAPYTQRIRIGWGQMMVLFIWPQSHLYGKINTKARSSLCCPWWGQHLGHYSGPICSLSRKLANCASKFGWILSLWVMLKINKFTKANF
jgi:hypothetical protein